MTTNKPFLTLFISSIAGSWWIWMIISLSTTLMRTHLSWVSRTTQMPTKSH